MFNFLRLFYRTLSIGSSVGEARELYSNERPIISTKLFYHVFTSVFAGSWQSLMKEMLLLVQAIVMWKL
jgi:hypothetical protein